MNIKEYQKIIEEGAVKIDALVPANISADGRFVEGNIVFKDRKLVDIDKYFKDNEIFSVKVNDVLRKMIENATLERLFITVHYGKDDIDYFVCDVNGADITEDGYAIIFCSNPTCLNQVHPNPTEIVDPNTAKRKFDKSPEGEKWDKILENIDKRIQSIEKLVTLIEQLKVEENGLADIGQRKVDESELVDEDFEDDEDDDDDAICDEDGTGKADEPAFDGYRCTEDSKKDDDVKKFAYTIEGEIGPDGVMKVVKTDSDGKTCEQTVKLGDMSVKGMVDAINSLIPEADGSTKLSDLID